MLLKLFLTVFVTVFIAEIGDKTQLATVCYAADSTNNKLLIFIASSFALIFSSAIGVVFGSFVAEHINMEYLSWIAGLGFIGVGIWTIIK
ncbi:GDT1 family protein [Candidatus Magnetomoraceae bacterium gMMP-15]